jgi:hypothetical protein
MMRVFLFAALAISLMAGTAAAQVSPGDGVIIVNGGYMAGKAEVTDESIDGVVISFAYEKLDWQRPVSFGFNLGYSAMSFENTENSENVSREIRTFPMYVGGKGWLGKGRIQGYLGAALGLYFSSLRTTRANSSESTVSSTGFGMGIPVGGTLSISKGVFINVNYTLNWLWSNQYVKNDILHVVNVGLGFNLGK